MMCDDDVRILSGDFRFRREARVFKLPNFLPAFIQTSSLLTLFLIFFKPVLRGALFQRPRGSQLLTLDYRRRPVQREVLILCRICLVAVSQPRFVLPTFKLTSALSQRTVFQTPNL